MGSFRPIASQALQPHTKRGQNIAAITRLLNEAEQALYQDSQAAYAYLDQAMHLLRQENASASCNARPTNGLTGWQIRRLDDHIRQHLDTPIRTCRLAALLNLSTSHFSHIFKQTFDITPLTYVARKRIDAAREMMQSTDQPLTHIAHAHGFCDQSHFSRTFRRETGISPLVWRQRCNNSDSPAPISEG